jgi:exoribonuclease R
MALIGEKTRKVFRLGDPLRVKVTEADPKRRQITLSLV